MIDYVCPHCQHLLHVPDQYAGKSGKCKHCGATVTISVAPSSDKPETDCGAAMDVRQPTSGNVPSSSPNVDTGLVDPDSHKSVTRRFPGIPIVGAALCLILVGTAVAIGMARSESPTKAYARIMSYAEHGQWAEVWTGIDKRSQGRLEVSLEMLAKLASAFNDDAKAELENESGKDLFVRMASSRDEIREQFGKREVASEKISGDQATLEVWTTDNKGAKTKETVSMLFEDRQWKLAFRDSEAGENAKHATSAETKEISKQLDSQVTEATPPESTTPNLTMDKSQTKFESSRVAPVQLSDPDFRNVKWGMSRAEVQAQESAELSESSKQGLAYKGEIAGLSCTIGYVFVNDQLASAGYFITERHSNKNDFISDYDKLKELLTSKYGSPKSDRTHWKNDLFKDRPEDYGTAISYGHLLLLAQWEFPETDILLSLMGENFETSFGIFYSSTELKALVEETKQKQATDDL